jgi:hypothetical protein
MGKAKCTERWLRSSDHAKWAEAMTRCRNAGGTCGADGYCHYGDCFGSPEEKAKERFKRLQQFYPELIGYRVVKVDDES